jgi:phosphate transport system permease protein
MSSVLVAVSARRRGVDRVMRALVMVGMLIALVPLVLVIYYLLDKGLGAFGSTFFLSDPTGDFLGQQGGIKSAILGTIEIVALASVIAIPFGIAVALYLVEFAKANRFGQLVRYLVDVMTGVPSIVFGLFIYITLVLSGVGGSFAGWKGSVALALLMLPLITRASEVVLSLVPDALREGALALGIARWRVIVKVVLPTAFSGLLTAWLLAIARAAGETAPLLFTATAVNATTFDLGQRMNSLPVQIYTDISQPNDMLIQRAWGAALTLVLMILAMTLIARLAHRTSRLS